MKYVLEILSNGKYFGGKVTKKSEDSIYDYICTVAYDSYYKNVQLDTDNFGIWDDTKIVFFDTEEEMKGYILIHLL